MNKRWLIWVIIGGVVVAVLLILNSRNAKESASLTEVFPEDQMTDIEYEFVNQATPEVASTKKQSQPTAAAQTKTASTQIAKSSASVSVSQSSVSTSMKTSERLPKVPYTIQVVSYKEKDKADKTAQVLKDKGFSTYIVTRDLKEQGVWYRVYVGEFQSKAEAQQLLAEVQKQYKDSFIIVPK